MSAEDRRIVPRKPYEMPIRFLVLSEELSRTAPRGDRVPRQNIAPSQPIEIESMAAVNANDAVARAMTLHEGETLDLSERGVGFKSRQAVSLGQLVELFFTLPTELTGRTPEDVQCTAKVVHVDHHVDAHGFICVGASIQRFERITPSIRWDN